MKSFPRWINRHDIGLLALSLGLIAAFPAQAAVITQQATNAFGQDWSTGNTWISGTHTPSAGNDYVTPTTMNLRTPGGNDLNYTFGGDSLTIESGGMLQTKMNTSGATVAIGHLILNGGTLRNGGPGGANNALHIVSGGLQITGTGSTITPGGGGFVRNLQVDSLLWGAGPLTIGDSTATLTNSVIFTNAANTYSGAMTVAYGIVEFTYNFASDQLLQHLIVESGGKVNLSHDLTVRSLQIDEALIAPGVYDYSAFSTLGLGSFFVNGSGAITVAPIPEPRFGLLGLLGAGLLWRAHRSRHRIRQA